MSNSLLANWNTHGLNSGTYLLDLRVTDSWGNKVDAIKQVTLLPLILGVNEINSISDLNIYPNPANRSFAVGFMSGNAEEVQIELTDISGKQLYLSKSIISEKGKNTITLNTIGMDPGTYICTITDKGNKVQKLIEVVK